jgi:hypothetical protein
MCVLKADTNILQVQRTSLLDATSPSGGFF